MALSHALPLARSDGPFRHEAEAEAGRALLRLGRPAEAAKLLRAAADGPTGATSAYDLGCALLQAGDPEQARAAWRDATVRFKGTASAVRSKARLAWPEALAMYENLTALDPAAQPVAGQGTTEVDRRADEDRAVRTAVDYLLASHDGDGTWSSAAQAGTYRVAITALAARSLHLWAARLDADRGARARRAVERATAWLNREIRRVDPARMDSFGAAYLLDYFLDLEEAGAASRGDVPAAIRLLLAGQCPNGGWSYDYRFAVSWAKDRDPLTFPARTHSMNTGLALLALARARRRGHDVDAKAVEAGRKALLAMRERPGVYTYIYPGPKNFQRPDSSAARGAVCEHALVLLGASPTATSTRPSTSSWSFVRTSAAGQGLGDVLAAAAGVLQLLLFLRLRPHRQGHRPPRRARRRALAQLRDDILRWPRSTARGSTRTDREALRHRHGAAHPLPRTPGPRSRSPPTVTRARRGQALL